MRIGTTFALILALAATCPAELWSHRDNAVASVGQWDVLDLRFDLPAGTLPERPIDTDFTVEFQNQTGQQLRVPGFFNGGHEFVVRFTPPSPGEWRYTTRSMFPKLDGRQGTVMAKPAKVNRPGGVVVSPTDPHRFQYKNGDSYFPIAFECDWLFALDAENADDIPRTRKFVDTLAANGFNQIVLNVFAYDVTWKKDPRLKTEHDYGSPSVFPFGGDNESPDHSRLNIDYFKRLDRVIEYLDQKRIVAHLMIYVWNKRVSWPEANSPQDNRYFDYVVKRYQAYPNLVWDISKEALGYGHDDVDYITERIDRLRGLDTYKRLVTVHDYGYCSRHPKKLDFISVQLWQSELHSVMRDVRNKFPDHPILNIEHGGYEAGPYTVFIGNYTSPEVCLERAYQCVFAGSFPTHYWQGAAWNVLIADIESLLPADRPKLAYYRHLHDLVETQGLARLKPANGMSSSGFCLSGTTSEGTQRFVYYVPKENEHLGVRLPRKIRGQTMAGVWFDPFTGEYGEPIEQEVTQWPSYDKPPGERFAVFIVDVQKTNAK